jgi:hypothetical protein
VVRQSWLFAAVPRAWNRIAARRLDPGDSGRVEEDGVGDAVGFDLDRLAGDFASRHPSGLRETGNGRSKQEGAASQVTFPPQNAAGTNIIRQQPRFPPDQGTEFVRVGKIAKISHLSEQ